MLLLRGIPLLLMMQVSLSASFVLSSVLQPLAVQLRLSPRSPEILYLSVRNRHLDTLFCFISTLVQNASLSLWKLSAFVGPFEISEFLLWCWPWTSPPSARYDSTTLPSVGILVYSAEGLFASWFVTLIMLLTRLVPMPVFTVRNC